MTTTRNKSLLATFAHPDDEAFGTGGTLARYAAQGTDVTLICATRGEEGEISDSNLATPETLPAVREDELRCATRALGIREPVFLGYRDSGMAGTPQNKDPRAFINAPADDVVAQLVGFIRRLRPQVVLTFDPNGGYGHPDHRAIHRHTVAAFQAASDAVRYPEQGRPWQPERLFYTVIPRSRFKKMQKQMAALDLDGGPFDELDIDQVGWPDEEIHISLDVTGTLEAKWAALHCHQTQFGPDNLFRQMPEEKALEMMRQEHFVLAWPETDHVPNLSNLFP
jgi:N-acetyl-1-D-myo-inositol-2-amino-2-deoxy-alpha-D-glucopyranoside deacetylase